jgi:hypothetical protein
MKSMISAARSRALAVAAMLLLATAAVSAQEDTPAFAPAAIVITAEDGSESQYTASDVSIYVTTSEAYEGMPASTSFSVSLTAVSPIDAGLLQWSAQTAKKGSERRALAVKGTVRDASGEQREIRYDITEAYVTSFSASHSSYAEPSVTLSLAASKLTIDGIVMN